MLRFTLVIIAFYSLLFSALGQDDPPPIQTRLPDDITKIYRKGENALLLKEYEKAEKYFKKVLNKYDYFAPALRGLGASFELRGDYENASIHYQKAIETNPRFSRVLYYECADAHFKSGNYAFALQLFHKFDSLKTVNIQEFAYNGMEELPVEIEYYNKLPSSIRSCHIALDSIQFLNIPSVINLGPNINTSADEYFPFLSNDQKLMFYTSRKNNKSDENLLVSTNPTGQWRIGESVGNNFNTKTNEGMSSLVRDGRRMFFTACHREEVLGTCDIWEAVLDGRKIKSTNPVTGYTNTNKWESQASVNCDGSFLFFASNREGGIGGTDIWYARRLADGRWDEPVNLGDKINTAGDEEAPFITNDGQVLYFSSTGHLGLGEQDIFMARKDDNGDWGYPVNLGIPVNSSYRELGFFLSADGKTGYFASDRRGGRGGMDIYKFNLSNKLFTSPTTFVEGYVIDSILNTPVQATIYFKNRPDLTTDEEGRFFMCVPANDTLEFIIREKDYHQYKRKKIIPQWDNKTLYNFDILLDPVFRLPVFNGDLETDSPNPKRRNFVVEKKHMVLFEFDKSDLTGEIKEALMDFLNDVFTGKQVVSVEIIGYADDIGADTYNLILSEKRAKEVGVYLKEKGIRVDKIYIEGRGETDGGKPKWQNRRVEVIVSVEE